MEVIFFFFFFVLESVFGVFCFFTLTLPVDTFLKSMKDWINGSATWLQMKAVSAESPVLSPGRIAVHSVPKQLDDGFVL